MSNKLGQKLNKNTIPSDLLTRKTLIQVDIDSLVPTGVKLHYCSTICLNHASKNLNGAFRPVDNHEKGQSCDHCEKDIERIAA